MISVKTANQVLSVFRNWKDCTKVSERDILDLLDALRGVEGDEAFRDTTQLLYSIVYHDAMEMKKENEE